MNHQLAFDIATIAAAEARHFMMAAATCQLMPHTQLQFLTSARDCLHKACCLFEDGTDAEDFEDCYLPLFDALAHVTKAMYLRQNMREVATIVLFTLDHLRPLHQPA